MTQLDAGEDRRGEVAVPAASGDGLRRRGVCSNGGTEPRRSVGSRWPRTRRRQGQGQRRRRWSRVFDGDAATRGFGQRHLVGWAPRLTRSAMEPLA